MIDTIREFIEKNHLLRPEDAVLAAVSGGADSLCLLEVLYRLGYDVTAVHVQHHLRESAEEDARFTEEFCRKRGIPFIRRDVDVLSRRQCTGESLEEAARNLRYEALEEERRKAESTGKHAVVALAHHRNDQAETVLFHLIRGSGLRGIAGMKPRRGDYVRPLLSVTRSEIEAWMKAEGLSYCEDETNEALDASRNRIRRLVLPELAAVREDAVRQIAEAAEGFREIEEYLEKQARLWMEAHEVLPAPEGVELPAELAEEDRVLRFCVIREAVRSCGFSLKDLTREHVEAADALFEKQVGKKCFLPGSLSAERTYRGIVLKKAGGRGKNEKSETAGVKGAFRMEKRVFPHEIGQKIPEKECTKWFDYDRIKGEISFRFRKPGDLFSTKEGTHKKLKDWMIDEKIPVSERNGILLAADDEEVLWVIGYRRGESKKVTDETKRVLEITVYSEGAYEGPDQCFDSGRKGL